MADAPDTFIKAGLTVSKEKLVEILNLIGNTISGALAEAAEGTVLGREKGTGTGPISALDDVKIRNIVGEFTATARGIVPAYGTHGEPRLLTDQGWQEPSAAQIPFATEQEAIDGIVTDKVMSPALVTARLSELTHLEINFDEPNKLLGSDSENNPTLLGGVGGINVTESGIELSLVTGDIAAATYASQAEAEAGVDNTKIMTSLRVKQFFAAQGSGGSNFDFVADNTDYSSVPFDATANAASNKHYRFTNTTGTQIVNIDAGIAEDTLFAIEPDSDVTLHLVGHADVNINGQADRGGANPVIVVRAYTVIKVTALNVVELSRGGITEGKQNVFQNTDFNGAEVQNAVLVDSTLNLATNAELVAPDANNALTVHPLFWIGTETEYAGLTPVAGRLYFVKADPV